LTLEPAIKLSVKDQGESLETRECHDAASVQLIAASLRKLVKGDIASDNWSRAMYANDASPYEIMPACVVFPKSAEDVCATLKFANEEKVSVIARGGGSGLVGGALGSGIVIDFTRYMNHVISLSEDRIVCEPGVYRNNLASIVEAKGLWMPVKPSSSAFCAVGGMIGTNASGANSLKYGHMIDYLESADVVLYDGALVTLSEVNIGSGEWEEIRKSSDRRSAIYNGLFDLISANLETIKSSMPKVSKNSAGYRLDLVYDEKKGTFNPAKALCASEGTFGVVVRATLKLIPKPRKRGFLVLRYDSLHAMGSAIPSITRFNPSAAELMDRSVIEAASILNPDVRSLNKGKLISLIVEFDGNDEGPILDQLHRLQIEIAKENDNPSEIITDEAQIQRIWKMREEALGFAYKLRQGERRVEAIIEDAVVPPEKFGEFLEKLEDIYKELGLDQISWGHVSEGNIHSRPILSYKSEGDLVKAKELADRVYALVASYGGSTTGEHSDGIVRAPYIGSIYSEEMIDLFKQAKRIFDPSGLLNPGKKTDGLDLSPLRNLRYGASYAIKPSASKSQMNWGERSSKVTKAITGREVALDFTHEVEACFGCGKCRELTNSSRMCPVYDAELEEVSACRGRNNLLRWMNRLGGIASDFSETKEYGEIIYKNCIQCKMCLVDCPANTDVGKLMAEARARYTKVKGAPKGYKFFFDIDRYARMGCSIAPLSNRLMESGFFRAVTEKVAGIDRQKNFPPFQRAKFVDRFYKDHRKLTPESIEVSKVSKYVAFFYDTYLNYNDPALGMRIVRIFEKNDLTVIVPKQKSSGMPAIVEGNPVKGREYAEFNVQNLAPFAEKGIPIVAFSPSAGLTLKNDYLDVYDTPSSRLVSESSLDIHEFLSKLNQQGHLRRDLMQPIELDCYIHLHCHSIVQQVGNQVKEVMGYIPNLKFQMLENGCCGNGGSYSFIAGNYTRSMRMGRGLVEDIKHASKPVFSTGESCKVQLEQGSAKEVGLTSELLCKSFGA
jgi:FAD/FMN-containing dehydrogenase/Fe-S oxidoreductase